MPSGLSPAPYEVENRRRLVRRYHFPTVPTAVRNTFAGSSIKVDPPMLRFASAGAGVETNKIVELPIEQVQVDEFATFFAPGSTVGPYDFRLSFRCQMLGQAADPTRVNSAAFAGIQLGSAAQTVLTAAPSGGQGVIRLENRLDDPTAWRLTVAKGDGSNATVVAFTVAQVGGWTAAAGHQCELLWDPFGMMIYAIVDGVLRATYDMNALGAPAVGAFISDRLVASGILYSGTNSAATIMRGLWSAPSLTNYDTGTLGSGTV